MMSMFGIVVEGIRHITECEKTDQTRRVGGGNRRKLEKAG